MILAISAVTVAAIIFIVVLNRISVSVVGTLKDGDPVAKEYAIVPYVKIRKGKVYKGTELLPKGATIR